MKFLIFFAAAAVFGLVYCDQECFRAVFKECVREPVPKERMTLCDEIQYETYCVYRKAYNCEMPFWRDAMKLYNSVEAACLWTELLDKDKACYNRAINNSVCAEPIKEVLRDLKTTEDFIRANKKICNLFESYSHCVEEEVEKNCHGYKDSLSLFDFVFEDYSVLSNSLCKQLILPADEKDSRPDNFGMINVYASLVAIFGSA